jgi:exodeoxyribonuclease VII large subunit
MSLPDMYWVIAEISEVKENYNGHCYLELIEKQPDEKDVRARVRGIIWSKKYRFLKSYFENITGETLREGLKVLVKVRIEYHELYGLSLSICDIDPAFTIGDMAMKRQMIIQRLAQDGVFTMNKDLEFPLIPRKIAIISSPNAAGYSDFMKHLNNNAYGYIYYTKLYESPMQGSETESGILSALDRIATHQDLFDIVVIIRGGGSQTDLSWFDNYNIAYHVTQFPLPVITGIGHDKDMSVTDMVASLALKTPTAAADFIVDRTAAAENRLLEVWSSIRDLSRVILERNRSRLETSAIRLLPLSRIMISQVKDKLSEKSIQITNLGKEFTRKNEILTASHISRLITASRTYTIMKSGVLEKAGMNIKDRSATILERYNHRIDTFDKTLSILNPDNVLKRGYTITTRNGVILKGCDILLRDDVIETKFIDGVVKSIVTEKKTETPKSKSDT